MRRSTGLSLVGMFALATLGAVPIGVRWVRHTPLRLAPVVVRSPLRLDAVTVVAAPNDWYRERHAPRYGEAVPVEVTAYCLHGTTRRGRYVRSGIVAADPSHFPLARYVELYLGDRYIGRFLVDDTGKNIQGSRLDVWMPTCREARLFGRQHGIAVLVPRPQMDVQQAGRAR